VRRAYVASIRRALVVVPLAFGLVAGPNLATAFAPSRPGCHCARPQAASAKPACHQTGGVAAHEPGEATGARSRCRCAHSLSLAASRCGCGQHGQSSLRTAEQATIEGRVVLSVRQVSRPLYVRKIDAATSCDTRPDSPPPEAIAG
jgi:hypothetical protein